MEAVIQVHSNRGVLFHFKRSRLNQLFSEAMRYPLVMVCAGTGYGKTSSVHDFIEETDTPTAWMQISERDNVPERFWENYAHAMSQISIPFSNAIHKIGFPDTTDKGNQYLAISHKILSSLDRRIIVVDDIHNLENPIIHRLTERIVNNLEAGTTAIWISRSTPRLNITSMVSKGSAFIVSENDLRFTENEVALYFRQLGIMPQQENLREIMQDTEGWAFAINLIARSYQKAPGYGGYLRSAMKTNIFQVMETEIWNEISEHMQRFLVSISLIDHLSFELIELLAQGDENLIREMERQNAYIRRDSYINAYLIHPLFLEFLSTKQYLLSEEKKRETYTIAGSWCDRNGFKIDALSYYEKIGDYAVIVSVLNALPAQMPYDIAKYAATIFERTPTEAFETVPYLAVSYIRCLIRQGLWQRASELAAHCEEKFLKLPENDTFRNRNLGGLYLVWGYLRNFMCTGDNVFDFDRYFEKFCQYYDRQIALNTDLIKNRIVGPWINANGSSKKGAPEEYINALSRATAILPYCFGGFMAGEDDLAWGELKFFQGDLNAAEAYIAQGMRKAREFRQYEIQHRALLYTLRISIAQGNYVKAEQTLKEMKAHLGESDYSNRYVNHDISLAWYYYVMDMPEKIPDWIKQNISPYGHPSSIENFENQIKARYCYITRNFPPLLAHVKDLKQRESYLYGRVVMMTLETCAYYRMKDKRKAFAALAEAYEDAMPNGLIMPFIEMGKDMRTLTASAMKDPDNKIPLSWLENVNRKAASYAKRQAHVIAEYRKNNNMGNGIVLSTREREILTDLSHGLSRTEIAANKNLSVNTVKMIINFVYTKLGAGNLADLIRIATERKMI